LKNDLEQTLLVVATNNNLPLSSQAHIFSGHPLNEARFQPAAEHYLTNLLSSPPTSLSSFPLFQQNGFVELVSDRALLHDLSTETLDLSKTILDFIATCPLEVATALAHAADFDGRTAMNQAVPDIKSALQARLLFLGQYQLVPGQPIHKSATCTVKKAFDERADFEYKAMFKKFCSDDDKISKEGFKAVIEKLGGMSLDDKLFEEKFRAADTDESNSVTEDEFVKFCRLELDKGQKREVVFKFMKNKDQFERELAARTNGGDPLDPRHVVCVIRSFNGDEDPAFKTALQTIPSLSDYNYAVLMPCADRNLDTIFRSERPDINAIRAHIQAVAEDLCHVHSKKLVHGDAKLLNVVRINGRLYLIDLDASATIGDPDDDLKFYAGAKFSSGVLPPEMIFRTKSKTDVDKFTAYFKSAADADPELWRKIKPVASKGKRPTFFMVKTFLTELVDGCEQPVNPAALPYSLVEARPSFDLWSLGTILYALVTGGPLFQVNRDDDLNTDSIAALHDWDESNLQDLLSGIDNPQAKQLLVMLLAKDPGNRPPDMASVLRHSFFVNRRASHSQLQEIENMVKAGFAKNGELHDRTHASLERVEESTTLILAKTVALTHMAEETQQKLDRSTEKICKAIFEADEVQTPTCFIILPYEYQNAKEDPLAAQYAEAMAALGEFSEMAAHVARDPKASFKGALGAIMSDKVEFAE
jgi:serine/threonine protein kinase